MFSLVSVASGPFLYFFLINFVVAVIASHRSLPHAFFLAFVILPGAAQVAAALVPAPTPGSLWSKSPMFSAFAHSVDNCGLVSLLNVYCSADATDAIPIVAAVSPFRIILFIAIKLSFTVFKFK